MIVRTLAFFVIAGGLCAVPARAEVVESSDTDFTVRSEVDVPADRFAAWAALVAPAKWWNPLHTWSGKAEGLYLDAQASGCFCEVLPPDPEAPAGTRRGSVEHLRVIYSAPGKLMRLSGGLGPFHAEPVRGILKISLAAKAGGGTRVAFEYAIAGLTHTKGGDMAAKVDSVLAEQLARLADLLSAPSLRLGPK